ncbi:MAG TPA: hypothetical protein VKA08_13290 [Balneolales bacterium]|nr:hypothetical protein [Balneolales bacterium]
MRSISLSDSAQNRSTEGYVYNSYGKIDYLKHVLASVYSLRRHDQKRQIALFCDQHHESILREHNLLSWFDVVEPLGPAHRSIIGFKHNVEKYMPFGANLFLDSDIIWCKNPDELWKSFSTYSFTITGHLKSDIFFGSHKDFRVLSDVLLNRRRKTLKRFGLTYLSRVQSGMIYAGNFDTAKSVCELANMYMQSKDDTHFRSRILPDGSTEESDEWGFAMAMSRLSLPVIPWYQGSRSPQLDFIRSYVRFDPEFRDVHYLYYNSQLMNDLRGIKSDKIRNFISRSMHLFPGMNDHTWVTPFSLHFGWKHEKVPFESFAQKVWRRITANTNISTAKSANESSSE